MEMEYFVPPDESERWYEYWCQQRHAWYVEHGISSDLLRLRPHDADELSHYSRGTSDVEFLFPWGFDELEGIANRGDYDLTQHAKHSGERLEYFDQTTNEHYVPHVIEPAAGATRTMMAFLMAAYAEGMNILRHANAGKAHREIDAETAPLEHPELYQYDFDLPAIAELWRRGSVVASWLLDLLAAALARSPELKEFAGRVSDSGEGRWTLKAAIDEGVPAPILSTAIGDRFASRGEADFANKMLAALRFEFGGHQEKPS
jgi:hypothetical protein